MFRDGRSFSIGNAYASNLGLSPIRSQASGTASSNGGVSQAYGSAESIADPYPAQTIVQAETYEVPAAPVFDQAAKAVAEAQNVAFYPVGYQNFEVPAESYEIPAPVSPLIAESSASMNGGYDSSSSSASSTGTGTAQSSAQTQHGAGNVGATMSNAKTYGSGYGSAASNANNGYASAATNANTAGYGSAAANANTGYGSANTASRTQAMGGSSSATSQVQGGSGSTNAQAQTQVNNGYGSAASSANDRGESNVAAKTQGYGNSYGSASSTANMIGMYGSAISSAKTSNQKGHHWHFGTLYDTPFTTFYHPKSHSVGFGKIDGSVDMNNVGFASAKTTANTGYGVAQSLANSHGSMGSATSSANTVNSGYGFANSNAAVNGAEAGSAKSAAQTNGLGYGSAKSSANTGPVYGIRSNGVTFGSRTQADAQTSGSGSANSSARTQGLSTRYRVANSAAKSNGYGSANANAQSM